MIGGSMLHLVIDKFADWIYRRAFRIVCSLSVEAAQPER